MLGNTKGVFLHCRDVVIHLLICMSGERTSVVPHYKQLQPDTLRRKQTVLHCTGVVWFVCQVDDLEWFFTAGSYSQVCLREKEREKQTVVQCRDVRVHLWVYRSGG